MNLFTKIIGFFKKKSKEVVVINMTSFDNPTIITMLSRFPSLAQDIFKELDNKSLIKCRKVSVQWQNFVDNQKYNWIRRVHKSNGSMNEFYVQWKLIYRNTPFDLVKELSTAVLQFFEDDISRSERQYSPLHVAADIGLLELSKFIIRRTGDKNPARSDGYTALHMAALKGHTEVCKHIIKIVANKNPADKDGLSPLIIAASHGHLEIYQLIVESLENKNPLAVYVKQAGLGDTPFHLAAQRGHIEVCKYIMNNLVDKNPQCVSGAFTGLTPYHNAAMFGQLEICKLFLENLQDKNPDTIHGRTPLHFAAKQGYLDVCTIIVDSVENKNPTTDDGKIHGAAKGGHLDIIRLLIANGADRKQTYNGLTPIEIAASYGHFRVSISLINTLNDIALFSKGIWNHPTNLAKALLLELVLLFGGTVIMMILSILFQYGTGIEIIDGANDYIKDLLK